MDMLRKMKGMLSIERAISKNSTPPSTVAGGDTTTLDVCPTNNPPELGLVRFLRDLDAAYKLSADTNKPIFLLFQEIPGCSTCTRFASSVLEPPLMVEAISDEFIPVAINNRCLIGHDAHVCKTFSEPKLNNPVVRFLNANGEDIIPRAEGVYDAAGMLKRMRVVLKRRNREIPNYMEFLDTYFREKNGMFQLATFVMDCYWQGEKILGSIDGVASTWPGWINSNEVVQVSFDPNIVSFDQLLQTARSAGFGVLTHNSQQASAASKYENSMKIRARGKLSIFRNVRASERKYFLKQTELRHLALIPVQAARVNAASARGIPLLSDSALIKWLSPRQLLLLQHLANSPTPNISKLPSAPDDFSQLAAFNCKLISSLQ